MASIFWDSQGVIMVDYLEEGSMITGAYYATELWRMHQEIVKKRRGKLQDNAPAHISSFAAANKCD